MDGSKQFRTFMMAQMESSQQAKQLQVMFLTLGLLDGSQEVLAMTQSCAWAMIKAMLQELKKSNAGHAAELAKDMLKHLPE